VKQLKESIMDMLKSYLTVKHAVSFGVGMAVMLVLLKYM
jgi:hypothetical protein